MPDNNLIPIYFKNKTERQRRRGSAAEIVVLDDRRPRESWQRLDGVLARLGLLARSIEITPVIVLHPPSRRGTNRGRR